jgi:tRNA/tmRNA/rRNA uracil-C5-methylase (TrmA/RlmC/RlmD family)
VLDLRCGCGATTLAAAPGRSVGIDISGPVLTRAREGARRCGLTSASFVQGDAQICSFEPVFDAVISWSGVMFSPIPWRRSRTSEG